MKMNFRLLLRMREVSGFYYAGFAAWRYRDTPPPPPFKTKTTEGTSLRLLGEGFATLHTLGEISEPRGALVAFSLAQGASTGAYPPRNDTFCNDNLRQKPTSDLSFSFANAQNDL